MWSPSEEAVSNIENVSKILEKDQLPLNQAKTVLATTPLKFLGQVL
jgi:hypothetical protein